MSAERIGIVGGGQLGRMLTEAAQPMGFRVTVVDPSVRVLEGIGSIPNSPALQAGAEQIVGDFDDAEATRQLAGSVDVVTFDLEHVNTRSLFSLGDEGYNIQPSPLTMDIIHDKLGQKRFLKDHGIPVADFRAIELPSDLEDAVDDFGEVVVKSRFGGYDGRGNLELDTADWQRVVSRFGNTDRLYAEKKVRLQKELSVLVVRGARDTDLAVYPVIETIQKDGQCNIAVAPARHIGPDQHLEAQDIAREIVSHLGGLGVFAVEMLLTEEDRILANEIAPRVHNSGHLTMEANETSQFEQHIRAVSGLPLGSTKLISPAAMVNILGERVGPVQLEGLDGALQIPGAHIHIYGKYPTKIDRKMGHITVTAEDASKAVQLATKARRAISI